MARWCTSCGRPLDDKNHDVGDKPGIVIDRKGKVRKVKRYGCRVRLVATNPVTGKTFVPNHGQRIARLDVRYVHEDRFEKDLKP